MRIDAHQHYWRYDSAEYEWIGDAQQILKQDYLPAYVQPALRDNGIAGTIAVQARQHLAENDWLLGLMAEHDFIRGVVGWLPLAADDLSASLDRYAQALCGVRHLIQDEPDPDFLLREDFQRGIAQLGARGLSYDLLVLPSHLPHCCTLVDQFPEQTFIVDHLAKPQIRAGEAPRWRDDIRELARRENVFCKLSGMVTVANYMDWGDEEVPLDTFLPYMETVISAFGANRVMYGSDWPVCTLGATYDEVYDIVAAYLQTLSGSEQDQVMGTTAARAYNLS